jgi:hypothetical protein
MNDDPLHDSNWLYDGWNYTAFRRHPPADFSVPQYQLKADGRYMVKWCTPGINFLTYVNTVAEAREKILQLLVERQMS